MTLSRRSRAFRKHRSQLPNAVSLSGSARSKSCRDHHAFTSSRVIPASASGIDTHLVGSVFNFITRRISSNLNPRTAVTSSGSQPQSFRYLCIVRTFRSDVQNLATGFGRYLFFLIRAANGSPFLLAVSKSTTSYARSPSRHSSHVTAHHRRPTSRTNSKVDSCSRPVLANRT